MQRACSQCLIPLLAQTVEGVEIDHCPGCGGLWLDAGEFDAVHAWYMTRLAGPAVTETKKEPRISDLVDGGIHAVDPEAAGNVLGEIVEFLCEAAGAVLEGL